MKTVEYIIEVMICSGLFLVLYRWLLAGKVGYRLCRAYIVGTMLLAALIPALDVPLYSPAPESAAEGTAVLHEFRGNLLPEDGGYGGATAEDAAATSRKTSEKAIVLKTAAALYGVTAAASIVLIILNIIRIRHLRRGARLTRMEDWTLAESGKIQTPFSFLRTVYMGFNYSPSERRMILSHEVSHVRHRHSYERLVLSALRSLLWFNPFLWIAEKDLKEVQEWEADRDVLNEGNDLTLYRTAIFKQLFGYNPEISSGLNHSLTKKRFIMMTKTRPGRYATLRLAAALPLLTATFLAFGCGTKDQTQKSAVSATAAGTHSTSPDAVSATQDSVLTITVSKDMLTIDGQQYSSEDIDKVIADKIAAGKPTIAEIEISGGTDMGAVTDVKNSLRKAGLLRVRYTADLGGGAVLSAESVHILPPAISDNEEITTAIPVTNWKYFHQIRVNSNDRIMMDGYQVTLKEIPEKAVGIIMEQGIRTDTDEEQFLGIFSIGFNRDSSPEVYVQIRNAMDKAYNTARDNYSQKKFGKPLDALSIDELNQVIGAVPKRIAEQDRIIYEDVPR
ncbi:MAG TPA: M48 family metalloprotease [Candidatus Coprenecus merdigallinarum]|nr:M48 family metalloprotease [Candidatus Coprenecus merdigallinarum]